MDDDKIYLSLDECENIVKANWNCLSEKTKKHLNIMGIYGEE